MAVEKVVVGDRVFCCDPETGCLTLKPVLRKTVRPEGRVLKIRAGGEAFEASGGHVFWVAGQGWVKAPDLRAGMKLHTLRGTLPVESVEPGTLQTTFGLVAADFHTFLRRKGNDPRQQHDPPADRPRRPGPGGRGSCGPRSGEFFHDHPLRGRSGRERFSSGYRVAWLAVDAFNLAIGSQTVHFEGINLGRSWVGCEDFFGSGGRM